MEHQHRLPQPIKPLGQSDGTSRAVVEVVADRFGCGAASAQQRRKCALFLWLLGPTTEQLATDCPCRRAAPPATSFS